MEHVYAVIMAGGVGSRFWPESRAKTPKQLLDLTGSGKTMIAATQERLLPDIPPERVIVVTGEITARAVADALPAVPRGNILAEPVGRNTAPCIGWAAVHVLNRDPEGILAVMPSDHLVSNKKAFTEAVKTAVIAAKGGALVTFGVKPTHPETGFGYIEMGDAEDPENGAVRPVRRFVEKPDLAKAEEYLKAGNFTWNSGMFFFSAKRILGEMERQMPRLKNGLDTLFEAIGKADEKQIVARVYPDLPSQSIDYGIMEGAKGILSVPVDFGWSDLGSWAAAYEHGAKDASGNAADGEAIVVDATDCFVKAPREKLVALVGVKDLVVVDTGDCLLICGRDRAQDVKKVVDILKKTGRNELL